MSKVPLTDDLPSNSLKAQAEVVSVQEPKRPDIPQFEGEVAGAKRKNKNSFLKWLKKMFLSDQKPSDIIMNVVENQIVPGMKDNIRNSLVSSLDMFMNKTSKPVTASNNSIEYGKIYKSSVNTVSKPQPTSSPEEQPDLNNGFTNPCFRYLNRRILPDGREENGATEFLQMMKDYDFPTLSVHTLYMMRKKRIDYTWDAYGWTRDEIANVKIVHISNPEFPWMIDLPPAHMIN